MEQRRADALKDRAKFRDQVLHGDAFRLLVEEGRADVLFLNPPYDTDPEFRRLEARFLERFTQALRPGGVLFFLITHNALAACTDYLAHHYLSPRAWRMPPEVFDRYRQVLVVASRAKMRLVHSASSALLDTWSSDPASLPELPPECPEPIQMDKAHPISLGLQLQDTDVHVAFDAFRPLDDPATGLSKSAHDLFGGQYTTAMPPKPVHIALAFSTGAFNGHRLAPNDSKYPEILLKGTFERVHVTVKERRNEDGEITSVVEEERPRLVTHILRLDTGEFHRLQAGVEPTGSDDSHEWNLADVFELYQDSLVQLLRQQFPALYDPHHFADRFPLPPLPRSPYTAQGHAVRACLTLLSQGKNPFLDAQVGTGKTTMSLTISRLLSPDRRPQLERLCHVADKLPQVERTLVLCPPHLLDTWEEEAAAVCPDWTVRVVRGPSDLQSDAQLYILSRETAKLGPRIRGISESCPGCGAPVTHSARSNVQNRRRCETTHHDPANDEARFARRLASLLVTQYPDHDLVSSLIEAPALRAHYYRKRNDPRLPPREPSQGSLHAFLESLLRTLTSTLESSSDLRLGDHLVQVVPQVAQAARRTDYAYQTLTELAEKHPDLIQDLKHWRRTLEALRGDRAPETPDDADPPLLEALDILNRHAEWIEWTCREPLYGHTNSPRRYPLSELIIRYFQHLFDLLILDEAHEFNHGDSAQAQAAHRLVALGMPTIAMTGSFMNGYASSLFANFHALSADFREKFSYSEKTRFVRRYGFIRTEREVNDNEPIRRGTSSKRRIRRRKLGEAPGIMPRFVFDHFLPNAVVVHKRDVDKHLPPMDEVPVPITFDTDDEMQKRLLRQYESLQETVIGQIASDRFQEGLSGKLFGALSTVPSYLDLATEDLPPFEVRYPESVGGQLVARANPLPADWLAPKEAWLLERIGHYLERDERVVVYLENTGSPHLPKRLLRLIRSVTSEVEWLDVTKVPTQERNRWIKSHDSLDVLLVNPEAVKTGLNSLTRYTVALWHQLAHADTYRQACGRLHRLGQTKPVTIEVPYYASTGQEIRYERLVETVNAAEQLDALNLLAALKAAGASEEETTQAHATLSLGEAIYDAYGSRAA